MNRKMRSLGLVSMLVMLSVIVVGAFSCVANNRRVGSSAVEGGPQLLLNRGFYKGEGGVSPEKWQVKNPELGDYAVIRRGGGAEGNVINVRLKRQSDYGTTFVVLQTLDAEPLRGKTIRFGGEAKTRDARVNIRLWTPEGNDSVEVGKAADYTSAVRQYKVPESASTVVFAMEVVGEKGAEAWLANPTAEDATGSSPTRATPSKAPVNPASTVTIDVTRKLGPISPLKFGGHVEWIRGGHGIWDSSKNALNPSIINLLKPLRVPVWRYPGGIYSDYYDWREGLPSFERRREGVDPFDGTTKHRYDFGVDEYITFLRTMGAEGLITANYGTGTMDMAVSWLRHFKGKGIRLRYWEIGNEVYMADPKDRQAANGARIYHTAQQYANDLVVWADALKAVDSSIWVGAIGGINNTHSSNKGWMDTVLKTAGTRIDFLALHNAFAPIIPGTYDYTSEERRLAAYRAMLAQTEDFKADVELVKQKVRQHLPGRADRVKIAITEHFPIFGDMDSNNREQFLQNIDQTRTMAGALYTASLLTVMVNDPTIFMANYLNPVHPYFSGLLNSSEEGLVKNPVYHVYHMFRNLFGEQLVHSRVEGPTFSTPRLGMVPAIPRAPYIETAAAVGGDGAITIAVVNRDLQQSREVRFVIAGVAGELSGERHVLAARWPDAVAAPSLSKSTRVQKDLKVTREGVIVKPGGVLVFPPCSFSIVKLQAGGG